jgi:hypothetical protein
LCIDLRFQRHWQGHQKKKQELESAKQTQRSIWNGRWLSECSAETLKSEQESTVHDLKCKKNRESQHKNAIFEKLQTVTMVDSACCRTEEQKEELQKNREK